MTSRVLDAWTGAALAAAAALVPLPAQAQANLSEQLTRTMSLSLVSNNALKNEFGEAFVDPGRLLEIDPGASVADKQRTLVRRASLYEKMGDFAKAEAMFAAALDLTTPPTVSLFADRGYYYMRRGRYGDAISDFMTGARLEPNNPRFQYAIGRAQANLGNYSGAIEYYDHAIKLAPRDATFYLFRAEARMHLDQPERALADYDRAIELKPARPTDRYFAYLGRGSALIKTADYRAAITNFDSALEIEPSAILALLWRGYAHERTGESNLALGDYERAANLDPADRKLQANLQRIRSN